MPATEKSELSAAWMEEACLSAHIVCRHFLMKTNYPLSAGTETATDWDNGADRASMKI